MHYLVNKLNAYFATVYYSLYRIALDAKFVTLLCIGVLLSTNHMLYLFFYFFVFANISKGYGTATNSFMSLLFVRLFFVQYLTFSLSDGVH